MYPSKDYSERLSTGRQTAAVNKDKTNTILKTKEIPPFSSKQFSEPAISYNFLATQRTCFLEFC